MSAPKPTIPEQAIREALLDSAELVKLSDQGGWIDPDSLRFQVAVRAPDHLRLAVELTEVVMEASGCCADRLERFGYVRLSLGADGAIQGVDVE